MMTLEYWYMLPVSMAFAATALASGIEGATYFTPFLLLVLGLPVEVAIGAGLVIQTAGFLSGLTAYARKRLIDYRIARGLLLVAAPAGFAGSWLTAVVPAIVLKITLSAILALIALSLLRTGNSATGTGSSSVLGRALAGVGGLLLGAISMGLGGVMAWYLLRRRQLPARIAVGTTVLLVAVTALVASAGHAVHFLGADRATQLQALSIVLFAVPGVLVGAQIGPLLTARLSRRALEVTLGGLLGAVAALTLLTA
ncbi:MAG: sulfite exporter TauE/SafE family protein [bacterium]|nr:sulfite exporter TauE/SafE family protein [bacterium]